MLRVAIAGGGTAGHVYAAIAIADAFRLRGVDALFLASRDGYEAELLQGREHSTRFLPAAPFARQSRFGQARALARVGPTWFAARRILRESDARLFLGVGGYASLGAGLAARSLGMPMVLHEANALPGLANRVLAPFAERICAGFANVLPGRPVVVTGNPVRYRAQQSAKGESVLALVLGGSEGSPHLNLRGPTLFAELTKLGICCRVLHFCGHNRPQPILAAYQAHGVSAQVEAFSTDLAPAYAQATFAVSCAGALTLSELANSAIPTFLVPLGTAANDHQTANARAFEVAPWFPEQPWNDAAVASAIAHHVSDPVRLDALRCRMRSRAMPDAAERIVEQALQVLEPERPLPRP